MNIASPYLDRRPWFVGLIGLLLGPVIGMLYLGRGRWALGYIGIWLAVYGLPLLSAHAGLLPLTAENAIFGLVIAFRLGGAVHCYQTAARQQGAVPKAWFARWYSVVFVGVILPLGIHFIAWEPFNIPSTSMEPGLRLGDYFVVSKFPYLYGEPQRGDIAVFWSPVEESLFVKRLIGLPGDRIQMKAGSLYINEVGVPREETEADGVIEGVGEVYRERLPSGRSYLIREVSDESAYGNTDAYEVPAGQFFFLGDNRDNSLDSRKPAFLGSVHREDFIGRVSIILWNSEAQKFRFVAPE